MGFDQGIFGMKFKYDVDVVFCIDATGSMFPIIDMVKKNVQELPNDILKMAESKKKSINSLRVRLIVFRDYAVDGAHAMEATNFFKIPEEQEMFNHEVDGIVADGGGDEPENGLEALAYAMNSDWKKEEMGHKRRQIIVVLTDASTHALGHGKTSEYYDANMSATFEKLSEWWGDGPKAVNAKMNHSAKRLILYAPKTERSDKQAKNKKQEANNPDWWAIIEKNWDNVIRQETLAGQGLQEQEYADIISLLVNSI